MPRMISHYIVKSEELLTTEGKSVVLFSTRTQRAFLLRDNDVSRLTNGDFSTFATDFIQALESAKVIVATDEDELASVVSESRKAIADQSVLYECIQPTAFCNFGCGYCGQEHSQHELSQSDRMLLLDRVRTLLEPDRYHTLRVSWFGGEPLLAMEVIRDLTQRLTILCREADCGYEAAVVTNGYGLTKSVGRELAEELCVKRVEVTIDGIGATHDSRRHLKNLGKTFDRIMHNFHAFATSFGDHVRCVLRCNVDRRNESEVPQLIELLVEMGLQTCCEFYIAPIHNWGNDASSDSLHPEEFARRELDWLTLMQYHGFRVPLIPKAKPIVCMAVNPSAGLTDPFGKRFNCTEVSLVPSYGIPNLYSLDAHDGDASKPKLSSQLAGFLNDVAAGTFDCATCEMLPVCGGGCPKSWYDGVPPCPSAKRNLPGRLRLAFGNGTLQSMTTTAALG